MTRELGEDVNNPRIGAAASTNSLGPDRVVVVQQRVLFEWSHEILFGLAGGVAVFGRLVIQRPEARANAAAPRRMASQRGGSELGGSKCGEPYVLRIGARGFRVVDDIGHRGPRHRPRVERLHQRRVRFPLEIAERLSAGGDYCVPINSG